MSIRDAATAGPPAPATRNRRAVDIWLDGLAHDDREAAVRILADPEWRHTDVRALFARHGLTISAQQMGAYRRDRHGFAG